MVARDSCLSRLAEEKCPVFGSLPTTPEFNMLARSCRPGLSAVCPLLTPPPAPFYDRLWSLTAIVVVLGHQIAINVR